MNSPRLSQECPVPALAIKNLRFAWTKQQPPLLQIGQFSVARGEKIFLYGPSGSGKTTLLNIISGVTRATAETLEIFGQDLLSLSPGQRDRFRARHIGVIFQQFNLLPYLSTLDNVILGAHFAGMPMSASRLRAQYLLTELGLSSTLAHRPAQALSVGQQQRVALARAMVTTPEIIIADEPTSALDSDSRDSFMQLLLTIAESHQTTILFVSHDKSLAPYFSRRLDIREFTPC